MHAGCGLVSCAGIPLMRYHMYMVRRSLLHGDGTLRRGFIILVDPKKAKYAATKEEIPDEYLEKFDYDDK